VTRPIEINHVKKHQKSATQLIIEINHVKKHQKSAAQLIVARGANLIVVARTSGAPWGQRIVGSGGA
jgi:hypothetical protein